VLKPEARGLGIQEMFKKQHENQWLPGFVMVWSNHHPGTSGQRGMKADALKMDMAGLSYTPAWLDQVVRPQQTMKICHFGMVGPVLRGDFRI
jgi:hypothetical protein